METGHFTSPARCPVSPLFSSPLFLVGLDVVKVMDKETGFHDEHDQNYDDTLWRNLTLVALVKRRERYLTEHKEALPSSLRCQCGGVVRDRCRESKEKKKEER
jgi:hypothetical protein